MHSRNEQSIHFAAQLIRQSKRALALTGAGISTPSGIPDFRSPGTGLWADDEAVKAATLAAFRYHPDEFYAWFRPLAAQMWQAAPNAAHRALADLESDGYLQALLTQNVDFLHARAGSQNIIPLHGSLRTLSCTRCFQQYDSALFLPDFLSAGKVPHCPRCGAVLKPDVILFGEQLPRQAWLRAQKMARSCDLMLVVGSSLEVLPVAKLPVLALDNGAHLIIVNQTPTYLDIRADVVFHADVVDILPQISERILDGARAKN